MKTLYYFAERNYPNGAHIRELDAINARNMAHAKRIATSKQCFQGTYLVLFDVTGDVIAIKDPNNKWKTI